MFSKKTGILKKNICRVLVFTMMLSIVCSGFSTIETARAQEPEDTTINEEISNTDTDINEENDVNEENPGNEIETGTDEENEMPAEMPQSENEEEDKEVFIYSTQAVTTPTITIVNSFNNVKVGDEIELEVEDEAGQAVPAGNLSFSVSDEELGRMDEEVPNKFIALSSGTIALEAALKDDLNIKDEVEFTITNPFRERAEQAIEGAIESAEEENYSSDWMVIGLVRAGRWDLIPADYLQNAADYINANINDEFTRKPTEAERKVLSILAAGGDPTNIGEINLINWISNANLSDQGLNAYIFALIAYDSKQYELPSGAAWTRERLIDEILNAECSNNSTANPYKELGGWALSGSSADTDMTGMTMTALAPYNNSDYPEVQAAINRAVDWLSFAQDLSGGYGTMGSLSSESCAQVIMGLCTNGIDPTGERFTKNGKNVIDALLSFELPEHKGFAHVKSSSGTLRWNGMATEQALYALDQYIYFLDQKGSIYWWADEQDETPPVITVTVPDGDVLIDRQFIFTVTAIDNVDGPVTPVVKLNGEILEEIDGQYKGYVIDGDNILEIEAEDSAGNKSVETYTINYADYPIVIERIGEESLSKGSSTQVSFSAENISNVDQYVILWIELTKNGDEPEIVSYSYVTKFLKAGESEVFTAGFIIPDDGEDYYIEAVICNDSEYMEELSDDIIIYAE
ncbi:hypothetical protein OXPF_28010 [Oxobacter pfennigii]|uniref:Uncharacterized protein n=1 Tax=Oxobacter pfennigii TaxID=36849 RepID=A0A0N8NSY9_9CLOT|nr:hypothetical protein [Oxobacter pfennigii]KPU43360.1 hypothetical protein OXPF_28010 [Oxobacter pfennigii]